MDGVQVSSANTTLLAAVNVSPYEAAVMLRIATLIAGSDWNWFTR